MRNEVMWAIRDSKTLTGLEKLFLYTIESRGDSCYATSHANASDMGISRATYYRTRDDLLAKGIITAQVRGNTSTIYKVNPESLSETPVSQPETLTMDSVSLSETAESHTETPVSVSETPVSLSDNYKKNIKKEPKEELEEEQPAADAAPIDAKVDQQTVDSLFVEIVEEAQIVKTDVEDAESSFAEIIGDDELLSPRYKGDVAAAIAVVIGQERRLFGDPTPEDSQRYEAARALAMDCAWKPDVTDVGTRVGQAFAAVAPVGVDW